MVNIGIPVARSRGLRGLAVSQVHKKLEGREVPRDPATARPRDCTVTLRPPATAPFVRQSAGEDAIVLPEVFECPQCQRQFVFELVENSDDRSIYCPQCKRYLGEKDLNFILISEIEELTERLRFERERLEKDEAVYSMTDCDAELRLYGTEVHKVVNILRRTLAELEALKQQYR